MGTYRITKGKEDHGIQKNMIPLLMTERARHQRPNSPFLQILQRIREMAKHKHVQPSIMEPLRVALGVLPDSKDGDVDGDDRVDHLVGRVDGEVSGELCECVFAVSETAGAEAADVLSMLKFLEGEATDLSCHSSSYCYCYSCYCF